MPPRVKRAVTKKSYKEAEQEDADDLDFPGDEVANDDDFEAVDEPVKRATKKAKKGKASRKTAKLEAFQAMPLDVLTMVCAELSPLDLLRLSMVSKVTRVHLLSPALASAWIVARQRCGLPEQTATIPMTEQQYAALVFLGKCQICNVACATADYDVRRRLCKKHRRDLWLDVWRENTLKNKPKYKNVHPETQSCALKTKFKAGNWNKVGHLDKFMLAPDALALSAKLFALEAESQTALDSFVQQRKAFVASVPKDAVAIAAAVEQMLASEAIVKNAIKNSKKTASYDRQRFIRDKLLELNYTWNEISSEILTKSNIFKKSQAIDDAGWEVIRPAVEKIMVTVKADKAEQEKRRQDTNRQNLLLVHFHAIRGEFKWLRFGDFVYFPSVQALLEEADGRVKQEEWQNRVESVKQDARNHREALRIQAVRTILAGAQGVPIDKIEADADSYPADEYGDDFLKLASSGLACSMPECARKGYMSFSDMGYGSYGEDSDDEMLFGYGYGMPEWISRRPQLFGSLDEILDHQVTIHSDFRSEKLTTGHFEQPPLLAQALKKLVSILKLDAKTALLSQVLTERDFHIHWRNNPSASKAGKWWSVRDLLEEMYKKAHAARKRFDQELVFERSSRLYGAAAPDAATQNDEDSQDEGASGKPSGPAAASIPQAGFSVKKVNAKKKKPVVESSDDEAIDEDKSSSEDEMPKKVVKKRKGTKAKA